jgi:hypothetical protein
MWKNVGKKMIDMHCPLRSSMFSTFKREKMGQLGSKIIFVNSNVELIKTYIFH